MEPKRLLSFESDGGELDVTTLTKGAPSTDRPCKRRRCDETALMDLDRLKHPHRDTYAYRPITEFEIRVLYLYPGEFDAPLHGELAHVDLVERRFSEPTDAASHIDGFHGYEAISYAWGEADFLKELHIENSGMLRITSSLDSALRYLRRKDTIRALWADQVCINQSNTTEKSNQVSAMYETFSMASKVLVWLGSPEEGDTLAFCTLQAMREILDGKYTEEEDLMQVLIRVDSVMKSPPSCSCCAESCVPQRDGTIEGLLAVHAIYKRPWFSRLWVVQEIQAAVSNAVICVGKHVGLWHHYVEAFSFLKDLGGSSTGMKRLRDAGLSLRQISNIQEDYFNNLEALLLFKGHFSAGPTLVYLCEYYLKECTDPLDRLFALDSVLQLRERHDLRPDYSLSPAEAFKRLALACLCSTLSAEYGSSREYWFALVGTESDRPAAWSLPSWVPNLHRLTGRSYAKADLYCSRSRRAQFKPFPMLSRFSKDAADDRKLWIRGHIYAKVDEVFTGSNWPKSSPGDPETMIREDVRCVFEWFCRCKRILQSTFGSMELGSSFVDLLLCGARVANHKPGRYDTSAYGDIGMFSNCDLHGIIGQSPSWTVDDESLFRELLGETKMWDLVDQDRHLCRITGQGGGDVAWMPQETRPDDLLCIIAGAQYPFVVREHGDGCYQMLGDAYTSKVTLKEALGAESAENKGYLLNQHRPDMDWNEESREMRRLIRGLEWIALR